MRQVTSYMNPARLVSTLLEEFDEAAVRGQPFFGLLAVQIPHAPFREIATLPDWDEAYANDPHYAALADQTRQWAAMVTRIDAHFGNILAALEDPNGDGDQSDSVAENTFVDTVVNGQFKRLTLHSNRNGFAYAIDVRQILIFIGQYRIHRLR